MEGIINIYKERGYTSHDVVAKLRGILGIRKIGHTGTLDPDATGVLPVCVGKATKVCDVLTDRDKTYVATVMLGLTTDTLDISGEVLEQKPVEVTKDGLIAVLSHFKGEITQIPPMYSAVKIDGKKLYEYAREGREVKRKERRVVIHDIELLDSDLHEWDPSEKCDESHAGNPSFSMRIKCSKGTYIRTLCDDIGRELGCGAVMSALERTAVGRFAVEDTMKLSEIEEAVKSLDGSENPDWMLPVDEVFETYPKLQVKDTGMKLLQNGNPLSPDLLTDMSGAGSVFAEGVSSDIEPMFRIYGSEGEFYALYKYDKKKDIYKVEKYFH